MVYDRGEYLKLPFARRALPLTGGGVGCCLGAVVNRPVWFRDHGRGTANRCVWWTQPQRPDGMSEEEDKSYPQEIRVRSLRKTVRKK